MAATWTADRVFGLVSGYRQACVLAAAVDLELFDALGRERLDSRQVARRIRADPRAAEVILDALAALKLLRKSGGKYAVPADVRGCLTTGGAASVLAISQHHANCLRRWAQLARVARTGRPARRIPSVRGAGKDREAFIGGMNDLNARLSLKVVRDIQPLPFRHLLDVGGASGTWTITFLKANPRARATLFDLPQVVTLARRRLRTSGVGARVRVVAGNFYRDELPRGCDLSWVSAIVHQNSRTQNRALFRKIWRALEPGGRIAIRDVVMDASRTRPVPGALFAVNMLVGTRGGGTFTLGELDQDLRAAGFEAARLVRRGEGNDSVMVARRRPDRGRGRSVTPGPAR